MNNNKPAAPLVFQRNEDRLLQEALNHIQSTYSGHYASDKDGNNIQLIDLFESNDDLMTFARTNTMKYVARYGKKDGFNRKDLLKAIHCILWMLNLTDKENGMALKDGKTHE